MDASRLAQIKSIYSYHSSTAALHVGELLAYIAELQADLKAVAEALMLTDEYLDMYPLEVPEAANNVATSVEDALKRPVVQAILKGD